MYDTGFAPCIEKKGKTMTLSLVCCKPGIRKTIKEGDYLVGFYAKSQERKEFSQSLAYIAKVTRVMSMKAYHVDYNNRTDCIYNQDLQQIKNNFHDDSHIKRDLSGENAVISTNFIFFGDMNVKIDSKYEGMIVGIGYKVNPNAKYKKTFGKYFKKLKTKYGIGKLGNHIHEKPEKPLSLVKQNNKLVTVKSRKRKLETKKHTLNKKHR